VIAHYTAYENNSDYVLLRHSYLFTHQPLAQHLQHSHDNIKYWLRSVEEASAISLFQQEQLRETSRRVFGPFKHNSLQSSDNSTSHSSYALSSRSCSMSTKYTASMTTTSLSHSETDISISSYSSKSMNSLDTQPPSTLCLILS
jgi:hypothetical protein